MEIHLSKNGYVGEYLTKRAELGKYHRNDRLSQDKLMADAKLRGRIGTRAANEVIKAMDDLRARGY